MVNISLRTEVHNQNNHNRKCKAGAQTCIILSEIHILDGKDFRELNESYSPWSIDLKV